MNETCRQHFLSTPPFKLIVQISWPLFAAIFLMLGYDLTESSLIAQQGDNALTLYGFMLPILTFIYAIAIAVAVLVNMVIVKRPEAKVVTSLLVFSVLLALLASACLFLFKTPLLNLFGFAQWLDTVNPEQQAWITFQVEGYLNFRIIGWLGLILIWFASASLRAFGHHKVSAALLLGWMLAKFYLLNRLYQAVDGEFMLTQLAQVHLVSDLWFAFVGIVLLGIFKLMSFAKLNFSFIKQECSTSLVLMAQQLLPALSIALIMAIAARFDPQYVGAFAILFRIEPLMLILPMVMTASLPSCVGINYWHGQRDAAKALIKTGFIMISVFQLMVAVFLFAFHQELTHTLCSDCSQSEIINAYLMFVPFSYLALGCVLVYPSCLNAVGKPIQALIFQFCHRMAVPLLILAGFVYGTNEAVLTGLIIAHLAAGTYAWRQLTDRKFTQQPVKQAELPLREMEKAA